MLSIWLRMSVASEGQLLTQKITTALLKLCFSLCFSLELGNYPLWYMAPSRMASKPKAWDIERFINVQIHMPWSIERAVWIKDTGEHCMEIILLTVKYSQDTKVPAAAWNHCLIWQGLFYHSPLWLFTPGRNDWVIELIQWIYQELNANLCKCD